MKWYDTLGVSKYEILANIRKKYKELALLYHPDKNNGDDLKFKEILEAYTWRMCKPEFLFDMYDYTLCENSTSNDILEYIFNTRKLSIKITTEILKSLCERHSMLPFNLKKEAYINILFVRISRDKLVEKMKFFHMNIDGTKDELISRFLFSKIKIDFLE